MFNLGQSGPAVGLPVERAADGPGAGRLRLSK